MKNHRSNEPDDNIESPEFLQRKSSMNKKTPIAVDTRVNHPPEWALASPGMAVLVEDPSINWAISKRQVTMHSDETFLRLHEYAGLGQHEKILEKDFIFHVAKYSTSVPKDERLIDRGDDKDNYTPLIMAAKNGHEETVRVLVEFTHADVDKKAGWNETTAMMKAAEKGYAGVIRTLVDLDADMNLINSFGNTALMLAAEFGKTEVVEALLSYSELVDKDVKNEYGYTALILAAENGHSACVEALMRSGATLDLDNKFGKTALIMGAENGHLPVVRCLLTSFEGRPCSDVNKTSKRGMSALMLAAVKGFEGVVELLTSHGANIHTKNNDNTDTALTLGCLSGKERIVSHLISLGADVEYKNSKGDSCLMKACEKGNENIMEMLLEKFSNSFSNSYSPKRILALLTAQNKDGNTCLMNACAKGNLKVTVYLIRKMQEQLNKIGYSQYTSPAPSEKERDADTIDLQRMMDRFPTNDEFIKASYQIITNKDGDTAMTLLSKYYREQCLDHPEKFTDFVNHATETYRNMYMFDMLPSIVPSFDNPNTVLNKNFEHLFKRLKEVGVRQGEPADVKLLSALVSISAALRVAAIKHPLEQREINALYDKVEKSIDECMCSTSMDVPKNVVRILRDADAEEDSEIVRQALAFVSGPLALCITHDLTGLLGTAQISTHVVTVFWASLKPTSTGVIRDLPDLFQVRTGCTTFRYRPAFMFLFEGVSKSCYLILVAMVSSEDCGGAVQCVLEGRLNIKESIVFVMALTGLMFEIGEVLDRSGVIYYITDIWNFLDLASNVLVLCWVSGRFTPDYHSFARGALALSAVPMSIGLLRFLSITKTFGQLVIMVIAMIQDMASFLVIFVMSIVGFGIAFHSLFPDQAEFAGPSATFLTLFNAALGDHSFEHFEGHDYGQVGTPVMALYIVLVTIILLNLVIARMSSTFDKINEKSFEQWSMVMAKNVKDYLLISEKSNPLCMLPPPFNAISVAVLPFDYWLRFMHRRDDEVPSLCGSISDFVIGILTAPLCAAVEIYLVNNELWFSQIPRPSAFIVTTVSLLFMPVWYVLYLILIVVSLWNMERTRINKRTNRIIYKSTPRVHFPLQKLFMFCVFILCSPIWFVHFLDMAVEEGRKVEDEKTKKKNDEKEKEKEKDQSVSRRVQSERFYLLKNRRSSANGKAVSLRMSSSGSVTDDDMGTGSAEATGPFVAPTLFKSHSIGSVTLSGEKRPKKELRFYATAMLECSKDAGEMTERGKGSASPSTLSPRAGSGSLVAAVHRAGSTTSPPRVEKRKLDRYEEMALRVFFVVTLPIWVSCILCVAFVNLLRVPASNNDADLYGDDGVPHQITSAPSFSGSSQMGKEEVQESNTGSERDPHGGKATGGVLIVKLVRLNLGSRSVGLFGRKANTYLKATYGEKSDVSATVAYDHQVALAKEYKFELTDLNTVRFELFDRDTIDSDEPGVLLGMADVNIKPWIANGRFEGDQKLYHSKWHQVERTKAGVAHEGGDSVQLAVKINYDNYKKEKHNNTPGMKAKAQQPPTPASASGSSSSSVAPTADDNASVAAAATSSSSAIKKEISTFNTPAAVEKVPPRRSFSTDSQFSDRSTKGGLFRPDERKRIFEPLISKKDTSDDEDELRAGASRENLLESNSASNPSVREQIAAIREQIPELLRTETAPLEEKLSRLSSEHDRRMQEQEKKLDKLQQMLSEYAGMTSTLTNKMDNLGRNIISVYKSIQHNGHSENSHPNDRDVVSNGNNGTFLNGHCLDDEHGDIDDLDQDYHGGRRERDRIDRAIDNQVNSARVDRVESAVSPESGVGSGVGKAAGSSGRRSRGSANQ